jgi:ParB-like chromosome segregation protein Spo0J
VDGAHVADLVRALVAGATLPPPVVNKDTMQIVDGVHRTRAHARVFGDESKIDVDVRAYKNKAAMFEEAVLLNSAHGRKLDRHDQARIVIIGTRMRMSRARIAAAIRVKEADIERLAVRVVVHEKTKQRIPSKRGLKFMAGAEVSDSQLDVIQSVRSAEAGRLALELTGLLREQLVDWSDERIVSRLRELMEVLGGALAVA